MAISSYPASVAKRNIVRLTSGTSWTVPSGVTNIVATLIGGGGGGSGTQTGVNEGHGLGGQIVSSSLTTTPGASITYAIGAGGSANAVGGTTTFTGATSAVGGNGYSAATTGTTGTAGLVSNNGGGAVFYTGSSTTGGTGGAGSIEIEYWSN
jgi:hypothetical protein